MVKRAGPAGLRPLRYFFVIGLHPPYALVILVVIVATGIVTLTLDASELDAGLGMVLFAQMFLASTGFVVRARRGHFDPLLTHSSDRARIAAAHWFASTFPGVSAWVMLVIIAAIAGAPDAASPIAGGRAAALLIVSAVSWAAGFWLPRGAAGMLWMALLMGLVVQRAELLAVPAGGSGAVSFAAHTATLLVCPFLLLGKHPPLAPGALPAATALPLVLLFVVWRRARGLDVYLVDRS